MFSFCAVSATLFPAVPMHKDNICPLKQEYQISLYDTNPLGSSEMGIPGEAVVGEGDSCQTMLFLEDGVEGTVTHLLAPAWHYGSFACVRLTSHA